MLLLIINVHKIIFFQHCEIPLLLTNLCWEIFSIQIKYPSSGYLWISTYPSLWDTKFFIRLVTVIPSLTVNLNSKNTISWSGIKQLGKFVVTHCPPAMFNSCHEFQYSSEYRKKSEVTKKWAKSPVPANAQWPVWNNRQFRCYIRMQVCFYHRHHRYTTVHCNEGTHKLVIHTASDKQTSLEISLPN